MVRVSIIIPCYNRQDLLGETLGSLSAQTYPHWEAIIVDDGSQDQSLEVVRRYAREDERFKAVARKGTLRGAPVCRNQGLALATGEFVIFLDSDDLLAKNCLEHRVAAMDLAPHCDLGVYQTELFLQAVGDRKVLWNAYTDLNDLYRFLSLDTVWLTTGPIWRKPALVKLGGFDEDLLSFQDWAIHVKAISAGVKYFKEPVRDNFHRHDYGSGTAITSVMVKHPDHLISHENLFAKVLHNLQVAGLLDQEARRRVAGLFWWLAERWCANSRFFDAKRVWLKACELGLSSKLQYIEGCVILRLRGIPGTRRLTRLIQLFWPRQFYRLTSVHLWNTPVGRTEASSDNTRGATAQGDFENICEPKVSIGFPVYNGEKRIGNALDSILSQDFKDFELVICDNASTDNTRSICERYAQKDQRIRYFRNEQNIGVNPNHDRVFNISRGRYFTWFADDVEYLPGMLSHCLRAMEAAPSSVVLMYPRCEMIRDGQKVAAVENASIQSVDPRPWRRLEMVVRRVMMVNQFYGLVKREALAKTQLNGRYASSDYVLLAELAMLGEIRELPEVLSRRLIDSDRGTAAVARDEAAWSIWSGAGKGGLKDALPKRERLALEYFLAVWRSPIKPGDKLPCLARLLPVYYSRTSRTAQFMMLLARPWRWKRGSLTQVKSAG